jgi:hypothetical protein
MLGATSLTNIDHDSENHHETWIINIKRESVG